jgi:hypothetical protein
MPSFKSLPDGRLVEQKVETYTYQRYYEKDGLFIAQVQKLRNARARELRKQGFEVECNSYSDFCAVTWWDARPQETPNA